MWCKLRVMGEKYGFRMVLEDLRGVCVCVYRSDLGRGFRPQRIDCGLGESWREEKRKEEEWCSAVEP